MEPHGNNHQKLVVAIIPARYASVRLPGKMLMPIAGKPLIVHTVERANEAGYIDQVIVATDDTRIFEAVTEAGHKVVLTSVEHRSGSDRIAEIAESMPDASVVVNVQGDEPVISPATIDAVVKAMDDPSVDIATAYEPINSIEELEDPNIVKVVTNDAGRALYFSRSPIPFPREEVAKHGGLEQALIAEPAMLKKFKKHTGIYAYRRDVLLSFTKMEPTELEQTEMLEQLRALENGASIQVVRAASPSIGVDTQRDLDVVKRILENEREAGEIIS